MYDKVFCNQKFTKREKITLSIHTKQSMYAVIFPYFYTYLICFSRFSCIIRFVKWVHNTPT